jgi:glycosyltransferase involved in cell wall biosynthesis
VISNALQERALNLGVREDTICILPQGCDLETSPVGDRFEARQRLGLSTTSPLVVTVGAVNRSDATLLFDTLRLLFQRRQDWQVFMIGEHGAQVPEDLRSSPRLTELGFVLEGRLRDFMTACDALLVPLADTVASRARWPSRVNPFLAAGRTTVITRVGDLAALLAREGGGLVTDCTPEDLVNGLIRLFETPDLQARYETRARLVARDVLAWPIIVDKLEDFYLRLFH